MNKMNHVKIELTSLSIYADLKKIPSSFIMPILLIYCKGFMNESNFLEDIYFFLKILFIHIKRTRFINPFRCNII